MSIRNAENPFLLFEEWFAQAKNHAGIEDHTAMALATVDENGAPDVRMVLMKKYDARGFVFFTNLGSPKARHLGVTPRAALCFHWEPLGMQVRIRGPVTPASPDEADTYFASRERQSQIGAWASKQSQPVGSRFELEKRVAIFVAKYGLGTVPRPPFWSGFRVLPEFFEFWLKQPYRLHDRVLYRFNEGQWAHERLFP